MDIQALLNAISQSSHDTRSRYHLTLGRLIEFLGSIDPTIEVVTDQGSYLGRPRSYRGYYSDLSFEPADEKITAGELLPVARSALNETFEGYKGGDFTMTESTPLWLAHYGTTGRAIMGSRVDGDRIVLTTAEEHD